MIKLFVTTYRGYSQVNGSVSVEQIFGYIQGAVYQKKIQEIRAAEQAGDFSLAEHIKSQLPYYTVTAHYAEARQPYSLALYQDILTLDFDDMEPGKIASYRTLVNQDSSTLGSFLSPRAHGLKLFVYLQTEEAEHLRAELNAKETVTYATLEKYHLRMFMLATAYYEKLLGTSADPSGKDISRGFYGSYDPEAFLATGRMKNVRPLAVKVVLPEKGEPQKKKKQNPTPRGAAEDVEADVSVIGLQVQLDYRKALEYTKRKYRFEPSQRDSFLYCLANRCYRLHILEEETLRLIQHDFGNEPGFDVEAPVRNAYLYTNKTDEAEDEERKPIIHKVVGFLDEHYEFRRNVVLDRVEFRRRTASSAEPFAPLRMKDLNTVYMQAHLAGVYCSMAMLKAVADSDYARMFHPFLEYFQSLPPWDGVTDYIGRLSSTVVAEDQAFFEDSLRHWLVGMVACAIDDNVQNYLLLLLYGKQGKGKSFFIRRLLPPQLNTYYRNGMINPDNKDHLLQLSTCMLVNLEEFDSVGYARMIDLKRLIGQDIVTERKAFDIQPYSFVRRASFVASTNNPHCLQEIGENRRYLFNSIKSIDYTAKIDYEGLYAQALALYRQGYRYWYEGNEIDKLNSRNEQYRLKDPVEENLFYYYRAATPTDGKMKWLPAAQLLADLSMNGRIQSNRQTLQILVAVLEGSGFRKRITKDGVTEYAVVAYTLEERQKQELLPQQPPQNREIEWKDGE